MSWNIRIAEWNDVPQIEALIPLSVRALQAAHHTREQMEGALGTVFGVDTQLIRDGTYFVAMSGTTVVGCGGWSRRKTLFGADAGKSGLDNLLDPSRDAARIRAFFVHPDWARRGIGSELVRRSEAAARAAGFRRIEIGATLTGEALYRKFGYAVVDRIEVALANGHALPVIRMAKALTRADGGDAAVRHVIFLPGAGADAGFWRPVGDQLPVYWNKNYLGWPGLGHESPDPSVRGFSDLVRRVEEQLENEPADLVAQSMGGAVAIAVALKHPQRIRRLVLAATSGGLDVAALGGEDWRPAYRSEYPHAASWIMDERPDFTDRLYEVVQPTLILSGAADAISPVAVGRKLQGLLPHATLEIVSGGDHGFVHRCPDLVAPLVLRHLEA